MCVGVCACKYRCPQNPEDDIRYPGDGVTGGNRCWESSSHPLQKQQILFTTNTFPLPPFTTFHH